MVHDCFLLNLDCHRLALGMLSPQVWMLFGRQQNFQIMGPHWQQFNKGRPSRAILGSYFLSQSLCFLVTRQQPQTYFFQHELNYFAKSSPPWSTNTSWIHEPRQIFFSLGCFCWGVCPRQSKSDCYKTEYFCSSQTHAVTFNKPQCDGARRRSLGAVSSQGQNL